MMRSYLGLLGAALALGCGGSGLGNVGNVPPPECLTNADCADGEVCWIDPIAAQNQCGTSCNTDDDCDAGLECRVMFDVWACVQPPPAVLIAEANQLATPGEVQCVGPIDGTFEIPFTVGANARSLTVVPFSTDGGSVRPDSWRLPDGQFAFSNGNAGILGVSSSLLGYTAPLFVPAAPTLDGLLQPGEHTYTVQAETEALCSYVVEETAGDGATLDLNLYFVGLEDLNASSATGDAALNLTLETFGDIFAQAGVSLGGLRFNDVAPDIAAEFTVIDERTDLGTLVTASVPPGATDEELLSVNVFFVTTIDLPDSGAIGISQGIPGPVGLHGTPGSGVVLTAEFLRLGTAQDPTLGAQLSGVVLAHEVGHWLGLFHTSELSGTVQDPLSDTPECSGIMELMEDSDFSSCDDVDNLMFPVASPSARTLTLDQASVLRANPVTR